MIPDSVPERIRRARKGKHWNQTTLGASLPDPVSHVTVSNIETGVQRLTLDLVMDIARTLDVPVSWLLEPILE